MSLVGLAFTYLQEWHGMVFFCGYLMLSNLIMVSAMSFLVMNAESVAHKVQDKARRGWLIADRLVDDVKDFENRVSEIVQIKEVLSARFCPQEKTIYKLKYTINNL